MAEISFSKCSGNNPDRSWRLMLRGDLAQTHLYLSDSQFSELMGGKVVVVDHDDERLLDQDRS